jgi:UDP-2,3-diacylglucosamine pyrophosphatase LpxH
MKKLFSQLESSLRPPVDKKVYGSAKAQPFPANKTQLWVLLPDIHYPVYDRASAAAVFDFIEKNRSRIAGVVFTGDQLDNENISHHTEGLPGLRRKGGFQADIEGFEKEFLDPIDALLPKAQKVFIAGNHERFLTDFLEKMPEFEDCLSWPRLLKLNERRYTFVPQGESFSIGPLVIVHGDQVGSGQNVSKKLVEQFCTSVIMGHVHALGAHTKCSQVKVNDKWIGITLPCLTTLSPKYGRGRANSHVNGFGIVESFDGGKLFNVYPVIVSKGRFCLGGVVYGK